MHPKRLPSAWQRRVKWLLKWHNLLVHPEELARQGWGVQLVEDPRRPGRWFAHPVPGRGYNPEDEPERVEGPPPGLGPHESLQRAAERPTAGRIALALHLPIGQVREALQGCPDDADPVSWVRQALNVEGPYATA